MQELKDKQYRLNVELDEYTKADHEYHVYVNTVINLSRRIADIFESSEPMEKRAILGFILQNPTVSGKKLEFTMRKPFDAVLELATCPTGLPASLRSAERSGAAEFPPHPPSAAPSLERTEFLADLVRTDFIYGII
ncbi:MAG: hypothetical protein HYS74_00355 [Parcubacteria group bacterium]|nr:hypothetical protein [Parcubacteria group bacterium]